MKAALKYSCVIIFVTTGSLLLFSFLTVTPDAPAIKFPYRQAGLTERQAAAHLLSRFTYGPTPGQVDAVVKMGLEKWFAQQLEAKLPDDSLNFALSAYDAIHMSNADVVNKYPRNPQVLRMAVKEGAIDKDSVNKSDKQEYRSKLQAYMQQKGLKPQQELYRQFINQKILRAALTNNQLQEVLTDFWFNHFNVSITKNDCAEFIPAYERDVIRPNVLGRFDNLLLATAKSPAMLFYLDNFSSSGADTDVNNQRNPPMQRLLAAQGTQMEDSQRTQPVIRLQKIKKAQGLNENYAREVMELHTLGVDGGYTQQDVTQAAQVLTGWTVYPLSDYGNGNAIRNLINRVGEDKLTQRGFVHEGDFIFTPNRHDKNEKTVLGKHFAAGGGYEEGVQLLTMLAHHPSTARFISKKIAVRFVSDNPPQTLLDKMAKTFMAKDGDITQVLITMVSSPEFWSAAAVREKTKSPFELAISSVRSLNATIRQPYQLYNWINKMGQKMYFYQAPTGFPDKAQYWINTGALLNRMNFGLALASQRIPGVTVDLIALNHQHEPESAEAALVTYGQLIMPERDLQQTVKRLAPLLNDPGLVKKVDEAANKTTPVSTNTQANQENAMMNESYKVKKPADEPEMIAPTVSSKPASVQAQSNGAMLAQVVGIIIGSPEFQRR